MADAMTDSSGELLEIYDLEGRLLGTQKRKEYYADIKKEFAETGKVTKQVKTVRMFLMTSGGRIYLQKRSKAKKENPGLYDKTIGGHVVAGTGFDVTVVKECSEELGFPAAVLPVNEFDNAIRSIDLNIIGIFKQIDYVAPFESVRVKKDGGHFSQLCMNAFYAGYYNGPLRFADGESSGIEVFSLDELKEELKENPKKYTEDLKYMVDRFEKHLKPIK